jgi:hypothetical protein
MLRKAVGPLRDLGRLILLIPLTFWVLAASVPIASTQEPSAKHVEAFAKPSRPVQSTQSQATDELRSITVEFEMNAGDEGVLVMGGDESELFSLDVIDGRLVWTYQCIFQERPDRAVSDRMKSGTMRLRLEFDSVQSADLGRHRSGRMFINGDIVHLTGRNDEGADFDPKEIPSNVPAPDFSFTGKIYRVVINENSKP